MQAERGAAASTLPRAVKAAPGGVRKAETKPNATSMRDDPSCDTSTALSQSAVPAALVVHPVAAATISPGLAPGDSSTTKAGAVELPATGGSDGAPVLGQLQLQPVSPRTQAACSDLGVPPSFQVVGCNPPSTTSYRR